jgi:hypothetical protein
MPQEQLGKAGMVHGLKQFYGRRSKGKKKKGSKRSSRLSRR